MHLSQPRELRFRKSSYSVTAQECVEVALTPDFTAVRDSVHPGLGHLAFPATEWLAFLTDLKSGSR